MADEENAKPPTGTRLFSCYMRARDMDIANDAVMLCHMTGDQIDYVSLQVAAESMKKWINNGGKI